MPTPASPLVLPAAEVVNHLPMPPWLYGALGLTIFLLLLLLVWMFRHTARAIIEGDAAAARRAHDRRVRTGHPGAPH